MTVVFSEDEDELKIGTNIDVIGAFIELVKRNTDFQNTQVFKDFRRNFISAYILEVRKGKIRIESDYCVASGSPMELLQATVGQFDGTSKLKDNELYCSRFDDGDEVIGFRNPHINAANIGIQKNKEIEDLKEYFNCTPNIVFLNSIGFPILSTYQGEDFDIDANLLTKNKIIVDACKSIVKEKGPRTDSQTQITPIPINKIHDSGSNDALLTGENMSEIDHTISENYIGHVINLSQEINSLMNHLKYNNEATAEELNELYDRTSRLSSMSQCEIDKAKKQFEKLDVPKELKKMKIGLELVDNEHVVRIKAEVKALKEELKALKADINEFRKQKRKPISRSLGIVRKKLVANDKGKKKLTEIDVSEFQNRIAELNAEIQMINIERQEEIVEAKNKISAKHEELSKYDSRRMKPYFFKYIGDNKAKKQRAKTNKKHRKEIDKPIILKYCLDNGIEIKDLDMKNEDLVALLKVNDDIQEEWKNKIYKKMDTPMDWLQDEMDKVEDAKKIGTVQVIELVKKNKHAPNMVTVDYVVKIIKYLDERIKAYRLNEDLSSKEKLKEIRYAKYRASRDIRELKLSKTDLYGIMKKCLNSVKKNNKVDVRSSIESISLEILFKSYGTKLLSMFC